jgi:hypothetical protein
MDIYNFYITPEEYEIAAKNGISKKVLDYRVREALWDKEKAINTTTRTKKSYPKEIIEIAKKNGVCIGTFKSRVNLMGWDMVRAATTPVMDTRENIHKAYKKVRKYPKEFIELARSNEIPDKCFYQRIERDRWSIEKAATTPVMTASLIGKMNKEKCHTGIDLIFAYNKAKKVQIQCNAI